MSNFVSSKYISGARALSIALLIVTTTSLYIGLNQLDQYYKINTSRTIFSLWIINYCHDYYSFKYKIDLNLSGNNKNVLKSNFVNFHSANNDIIYGVIYDYENKPSEYILGIIKSPFVAHVKRLNTAKNLFAVKITRPSFQIDRNFSLGFSDPLKWVKVVKWYPKELYKSLNKKGSKLHNYLGGFDIKKTYIGTMMSVRNLALVQNIGSQYLASQYLIWLGKKTDINKLITPQQVIDNYQELEDYFSNYLVSVPIIKLNLSPIFAIFILALISSILIILIENNLRYIKGDIRSLENEPWILLHYKGRLPKLLAFAWRYALFSAPIINILMFFIVAWIYAAVRLSSFFNWSVLFLFISLICFAIICLLSLVSCFKDLSSIEKNNSSEYNF